MRSKVNQAVRKLIRFLISCLYLPLFYILWRYITRFFGVVKKNSLMPYDGIKASFLRDLLYAKMDAHPNFEFNSIKLKYFFHSYNNFRLTCRCIEIPIIKYYLGKFPHINVLEIGNVTKHYYNDFKNFNKKDTVDKYELAYDVINADIKDFKSDNKYDFVYSISTFEHMDSDGGDNPDFTPIKSELFSSHAFENMNRVIDDLLLDNGKFIMTFPLGLQNCEIDGSLYNKEYLKFNVRNVNLFFFKQIDELTWEQVDVEVNQLAKEKPKYPDVTYIGVMEITK